MAVDLITVIFGSFNTFISIVINITILLLCLYFYNQTRNNGFLLISIGQLISIVWNLIILLIFKGVYFALELSEQGYSASEIAQMSRFLGLISMFFYLISSFLLIMGLIIIGSNFTRENKRTDYYQNL